MTVDEMTVAASNRNQWKAVMDNICCGMRNGKRIVVYPMGDYSEHDMTYTAVKH